MILGFALAGRTLEQTLFTVWEMILIAFLVGCPFNAFEVPIRQAFCVQWWGRGFANAIARSASISMGARVWERR